MPISMIVVVVLVVAEVAVSSVQTARMLLNIVNLFAEKVQTFERKCLGLTQLQGIFLISFAGNVQKF